MNGAPITMTPVLGLAWVGLFLVIGMFLRAYVPFFRKYLIPSCIIGGVLGFCANNAGFFSYVGFGVDAKTFQIIIYHLFNLTWIFLGLQRPVEGKGQGGAGRREMWTCGLLTLLTFSCMFAVVLIGIALQEFGSQVPASMGLLTVLGFANGPGQALTVASIWESKAGLAGAMNFGLATSSMGYLIAIIGGIPMMFIFAKRRKVACVVSPTPFEQKGIYEQDKGPIAGNQTTTPSSLDTMSFHVAMGFVAYFVVLILFSVLGHFLPSKVMSTIWGLFFVIAMGTGITIRRILKAAKIEFLCCRNLISRVNGFLVDFLACATFISIEVGSVMQYLNVFIVTTIAVTLVMTLGCWLLYKDEPYEGIERFGMAYGTLTGTISTGMVLLRMVDPDNKSTAAVEFGVASFLNTPFIVLYMFLCNWDIIMHQSLWILVGFYAACVIAGAVMVYWFRPKKNSTCVGTCNPA